MKLWVMSDLHVDAYNRWIDLKAPDDDVDLLIVAGDIANGLDTAAAWLMRQREVLPGLPKVVWVPGNHDYYKSFDVRSELHSIAKALRVAGVDVAVLGTGEVLIHHGVRIFGATLWTDFHVAGSVPMAMHWADMVMPDYRNIWVGERDLTPEDTLAWHQEQRRALEEVLSEPFDGPTVVVTHHAPHRLSLFEPDRPTASDGSFASDLSDLILDSGPDLWVHGHVHNRYDYVVGKTRVLCNPRGYSDEYPEFDPKLVVTVGKVGGHE